VENDTHGKCHPLLEEDISPLLIFISFAFLCSASPTDYVGTDGVWSEITWSLTFFIYLLGLPSKKASCSFHLLVSGFLCVEIHSVTRL
jgi:hypothetical protein